MRHNLFVTIIVSSIFFCTAAASAQLYEITDLGTLGGSASVMNGFKMINAAGQVVGLSDTPGDAGGHAFRTAANAAIKPFTSDLGTLGGYYSEAYGINTSGQTVGVSYLAGNAVSHAFRTTAAGLISDPGTDLRTFGGTLSNSSAASGINASGQPLAPPGGQRWSLPRLPHHR